MKKASLHLLVVAALVAVGLGQNAPSADGLAQQAQKDGQVQPLGTEVCQSTFTSGSGLSYMKFCTTQNGNVAKFESPSTFNQLHQGGEGYGLCDVTNGNVGYYDWGVYGDSGWQGATITQPNGPSTFPLTITRTTADGVWTLEQVVSRNTATPAVKITMTLKNNSAVTRQVYLERFADVDADGTSINFFDTTGTSAFGRSVFGLMLRNLTLDGMSLGGRIVPSGTTNPCNNNLINIPYKGDAATLFLWAFYAGKSIAPQKSKTVALEYRAF
jgi:hypothetical protein